MDYMVSAGYDPSGMVETMQMLQNKQKTRTIEFFSTHPSDATRIRNIKNLIPEVMPYFEKASQ